MYSYPKSVKLTNNSKLEQVSIVVYDSTIHTSTSKGNNTLTFISNAQTPVSYTWTIPDGYFSAAYLNALLQSRCYANNLYRSWKNGSNVVYSFEIVQNSLRDLLQLNSYYIPTSAKATTLGYIQLSGATCVYTTTNSTPQLTFNDSFNSLIQMTAQTYPASTQATNQGKILTQFPTFLRLVVTF